MLSKYLLEIFFSGGFSRSCLLMLSLEVMADGETSIIWHLNSMLEHIGVTCDNEI